MGLARGLERRLEQLVDGLAARLFRGRVHPVELGTRIVREADLAAFDTPAGPGAPNAFVVTLGGQPEPEEAVTAAQRELEGVFASEAAERGWRLEGPARVRIEFGAGPASSATVAATVQPGESDPWARLRTDAGRTFDVSVNRAVVGRGSDADVHIPDDDVSRRHALLWREAGVIWLADLDSSNGTFLNGERLHDVADLIDGDRVTFGDAESVLQVL